MAERADPRGKGFTKDTPYRRCLYERYEYCNQFVKDKIVLDIPCGVGWGTSMLKGVSKAYGVDISESAIEYAKNNYKGIIFKVSDMTNTEFEDGMFDVVLCLEGYEHISSDDQLLFLKESNRILKKDGVMVLTTPIGTGGKSENPYHLHEPTENEFKERLGKYFSIEEEDIITGGDGDVIRCVVKNEES